MGGIGREGRPAAALAILASSRGRHSCRSSLKSPRALDHSRSLRYSRSYAVSSFAKTQGEDANLRQFATLQAALATTLTR